MNFESERRFITAADVASSPDHMGEMTNLLATRAGIKNAELGMADVIYDRLMNEVAEFEESLADDEEVGAHLASFGGSVIIRIEDIGYRNPYQITFWGKTLDASPANVCLIQHTTQLNVLLTSVKVENPAIPARRIGFDAIEKDDHED